MRKKNLILSILVLFGIFFSSYNVRSTGTNSSPRDIISADLIFESLYKQFVIDSSIPDYEVFKKALTGYFNLQSKNSIENQLLTVIDFTLSSNIDRLWILDIKNRRVIHTSLVAHGRNSGDEFATRFSNIPSSYQSSIGFYITDNTYTGKHGTSLLLNGMEKINDKARERAIVMHSADYVSKEFILMNGRLGRSFGCPSIPIADHERIIKLLSGKSCLYIHYPDDDYLKSSALLSTEDAWDAMFEYYSYVQ